MKQSVVLGAVGGGIAVALVLGVSAAVLHRNGIQNGWKIRVGSDFGLIRREALARYPIGSRIADVSTGMKGLGFNCYYLQHILDNTTAPTLTCYSNEQGWPEPPRTLFTLFARNGAVADIAVGNGIDPIEASARTPDPTPGGRVSSPSIRAEVADDVWNQMVKSVMWTPAEAAGSLEIR